MPITVFDTKGIPAVRRERIEAAVVAGGNRISGTYEAWIAADPFRGGVRVLLTGPSGFERRLFECPRCDHVETSVIASDPLKSKVAGWLAGELGTPN